MIGISGAIVIILVAAKALIGSVVVVAIVASCTVVGYIGMCAVQYVEIIVNVKGCRSPARLGGVTLVAICRQVQCRVAWVATVVVVGLVAAIAGVGGVAVIAIVTGNTIVGNGNVCPGEREVIIVVETGRAPGLGIVTGGTVHWELRRGVIRIGRCIVIALVAAKAVIGRIVVIAVVTSRTVIGDGSMGAFENEKVVVDGKSCRCPARFSCVAACTIRIQRQCIVVGIGSAIVITQVAGFTGCWRARITRTVAIEADQRQVCSCEREIRVVVIENIVGITRGVTSQTGRALVNIPPHSIVLVIRFGIGVATGTGYLSVIIQAGMAIHALIPLTGMGATVYGEILGVVVKS